MSNTVVMIDCSTSITSPLAKSLKNAGVTHIARYLSRKAKGLTATEVAILKAAGLNIVSIYETNPTYAGYFTVTQANADLMDAFNLAKAVGQPEVDGNAIYFAADYDAQSKDFPSILTYFQTIKKQLTSYKTGAYGSYSPLTFLHQNNAADYYFQTYAWSGGNKCSFVNLYQYQNDVTFQGIQVDYDQILTNDVGAWGQPKLQAKAVETMTTSQLGIVTVTKHTVLRDGPSASSNIIRALDPSDEVHTFKCYGMENDWFNAGAGWIYCGCASYQPI